MSGSAQTLFNLLPALYRLKDAEIARSHNQLTPTDQARLQLLQGLPKPLSPVKQQELDQLLVKQARGPLESLLMLVEEQLAIVAEDLDQFYDDQFIETCAPWVIPYIGSLIGFKEVHGVAPGVASPRAEVAHTIGFRRRKGTALVLEQLARDITGWGAHAVEFFQELATTQYMNHIRPGNHFAPDLRHWEAGAYINTGFDRTAHKVDVRRIAVERGRYNIQNVGIFLWSLNAYSVTMSPAVTAVPNTCFRFSSLGRDMPLFNRPVSQGAEITALAGPVNVPDVLRRRLLCQDIAQTLAANSAATNYDPGNSLAVFINGSLVAPTKIQVCDLAGNDGSWINLPPASSSFAAAIDPELGRLALPPAAGSNPVVQVSYHYGFNADMGGGEYPRSASFAGKPEQVVVRVPGDYPSIQQALAALPGDGIVEITDSGRYSESGGLTVAVKAHGHIELRAADGRRPTLVIGDGISITGGVESQFDLNGLIVTYAAPSPPTPLPAALVHIPAGASNDLSRVGLTHCTLVPGWALNSNGDPQPAFAGLPTLAAEIPSLQVVIQKSIVGGLLVNGLATAEVSDSIVDATDPSAVAYAASIDATTKRPQPGGALTMQGCTVVGKAYSALLSLLSNSIVWARLSAADFASSPPLWSAPLWASRKQEGCVRFSFLPPGSITPRPFESIEQAPGLPQPLFYSLRYGDAAYAKLLPATDELIRRGADDSGEMGAFHFLLAPLRETDLRVRIREFLPVGLEFGIFYQT